MEGLRGSRNLCWAAGIWGLEAAEVMSLEQSRAGERSPEKNKPLSLFRSSLQSQQGGGGGGGRGLAGSQARGCWETVKDAKQAPPPTLEAHIFVLRNLVCCQRPHFSSTA